MKSLVETLARFLNAHEVTEYCPACKEKHILIACNRADNKKPFRICPRTLNSRDVEVTTSKEEQ